MGDHLEALERLARMRGDGTLSEEEFQSEKSKLLAAPASGSDSLAHGREGPEGSSELPRSSLKWPIFALAILIPIFGYLAWSQFRPMNAEQFANVVADSTDAPASENGSESGKAEGTAPGTLALTDDWLVGIWTYEGTCLGGSSGMKFQSDGTYQDSDSAEGQFSTDGKSIRFYQRQTVPELGEDEGFMPKPLSDEVYPAEPMTQNSMILNGHEMIRC